MSGKTYVWNGPSTVIEVWSENVSAPVLIYSGHVTTGQPLAAEIDPDHSIIKSWLAFKLITEPPTNNDPQPSPETLRLPRSKKENSDG